jgi:haloacid dehalogenase-like hydrolase
MNVRFIACNETVRNLGGTLAAPEAEPLNSKPTTHSTGVGYPPGFGRSHTLVVDKTGTLTEGKPKVTAVIPAQGLTENDLLQLAASLERSSEHPLAAAILAAAKDKNITIEEATDFGSVTGKGVTGKVGGAWSRLATPS